MGKYLASFGNVHVGPDDNLYIGQQKVSEVRDGGLVNRFSVPKKYFVDFLELSNLKRMYGMDISVVPRQIHIKQNFFGDVSISASSGRGLHENSEVLSKTEVNELINYLKDDSERDTIVS